MKERLLTIKSVAAILDTTPGVAASILDAYQVSPIDLGPGRGRGRRWLASAVTQLIYDMHTAAQPRKKPHKTSSTSSHMPLAKLSVEDLHALTRGRCVQ